eukprot:CAMPEP_0168235524 /NCGR_PEP_ID=MMETSP0140_2-20121125/18928_1 /TAXON_ID=44445 /ORGANISM="Pseudo-nitzschia australis, Strain 10249 10 AB" /LENGTH=178 /DNA_ID=CAMNT_0008168555 /DNA_START=176 /DNA_END=712 /DNA_ORIENTATION=+
MTDEMKILPQGDSRSSGDAQNKNNFIDIDLVKAQNFASHFGKYSYGEIEHMRDDLHTHRLQNIAIGNDEYSNDLLFLERVLEDDLTSQLNALQDDMPDPYLFRYPDGDNGANFDTETKAKADPIPSPNIFHEASDQDNVTKRKSLNLYGELVEEGVLESLAICAMLGFLMMTTPEHFL